jgi:very-short-patch-repair endonuclease
MDFLLLLAGHQRVVIEVDGSQHFSADGKPSLALYSEMVSADRDLRLAGYEVYRFGSNELVGSSAPTLIEGFFNRRWTLHKPLSLNS